MSLEPLAKPDSCDPAGSAGPLIAAVAVMRESCEAVRLICDELEATVATHLELLDSVMLNRYGPDWWQAVDGDV